MASRALVHVPVAAGLTAAAYAGSLALVSVLQAQRDATIAAGQGPLADAARGVAAADASVAGDLDRTAAAYNALVVRYQALGPADERTSAALDRLAAAVRALDTGLSGVSVPSASRLTIGSVGRAAAGAAAPATHATTGASGH